MHRVPFILACIWLTLAAGAAAQKGDFVRSGLPVTSQPKASENTDYDVVDGLPTALTGELDADDSTYNRQAGSCAGLSGVGTAVSYDTVTLTNTSGVLTSLDLATSEPGDASSCSLGDTYMTVYSGTFNTGDPTANCLVSNDDGGPGVCSALSFDLSPGETAVVVVASFANGAEFPWQLNIDSPSCTDGITYDDGTFEGGLRGPMGTQTFEVSQQFDLPLIGSGGAEVQRICACLSHTLAAGDDFPVNFVIRRPNSGGGGPGARLHTEAVMAMDVPELPVCRFFTVDLTGVSFDTQTIFVGVEWDQDTYPELLVGEDTTSASSQPSFFTVNQGGTWASASGLDPGYRNLGVRLGVDEMFSRLSDRVGLVHPGYSLELTGSANRTSFLAVRNTDDQDAVELDVSFFGPEVTAAALRVDGRTLQPEQTMSYDLSSNTAMLDPDGDDVADGLIIVNRTDTGDAMGLEGDYLNVDFDNDFAAGDRLFSIPQDLCNTAEIRYLDFGSGTKLNVLVDQPRGDVAATFSWTAFDEAGTTIGVGDFFTNTHLNVIDIANLIGPANRFGTLVFDFSKAGGGVVIGKYSAFSRFTVEMNHACRD